jgi:release factor family 3
LSAEESRVFLGNCSSFVLIKSNVPENMFAYERDLPERTGNFSDPGQYKENLLDHFLHHLDQGLSQILGAYPLPVVVMGPEKVLGHFRKITKNAKSLVQFVHGNYLHASEQEIRAALAPYLAEWQAVKERACLMQLEKAKSENKLEYGIRQVWQAAARKNGRLLLVEKDFMVSARHGGHADEISNEEFATSNAFYIKDAVDDVMEKVLAAGGNIEFVSDGALKNYGRIALIRFY